MSARTVPDIAWLAGLVLVLALFDSTVLLHTSTTVQARKASHVAAGDPGKISYPII